MTTFLSAGFECWNCTNLAPELPEIGFQFIAWEPNEDWHPLCADCAHLDLEVAAGRVLIREQTAKGVFELISPAVR